MYGNKHYRVQDDGRGFLHIIIFEGKRKKVAIKDIQVWFEYGSEPDYIFNQWWKIYENYQQFKEFAEAEKHWINNQ